MDITVDTTITGNTRSKDRHGQERRVAAGSFGPYRTRITEEEKDITFWVAVMSPPSTDDDDR